MRSPGCIGPDVPLAGLVEDAPALEHISPLVWTAKLVPANRVQRGFDVCAQLPDDGPETPLKPLRDFYEVGHQRGTALVPTCLGLPRWYPERGPSLMAPSRTRRAAFTATGSPVSRSL
jgi:hypothetical protein